MCTSKAAKPARSNAAAISTWPLTPCSRRIAIAGRAPVAMYGAAMSSVGIERRAAATSPGSVGVEDPRRTPGRRPRDCRAAAAARASSPTTRGAGRRATRRARAAPSLRDADAARPASGAPIACSASPAARERAIAARRASRVRDLDHRAQLLGEQRRQRIGSAAVERDRRGRSATRTPSRTASRTSRRRRCRDRRAAGRRAAASWTAAKNAARRAGSSRSGATSPSWP